MEQTRLDTYHEILDEQGVSKPNLFEFFFYNDIADWKFLGNTAASSVKGICNEFDEKIINGTTEDRAEVGGEVFFNAILAAFTAEYLSKKKNTNTSADDLADDINPLEKPESNVVDDIVDKVDDVSKCADGVVEGGTDVWEMTEGGGIINGREYSQHAMERMAPDTPAVRAELSRRAETLAESKGLQVGTPEYYQFCQKYVDPRNIPPVVIEDAIRNTTAVPGHTLGTFMHQTTDVTVIVDEVGNVITVIPN